MDDDNFNWFDCDNDVDELEIKLHPHKKSYFSRVFDFLSTILLYVFIISLFNSTFFFLLEDANLPEFYDFLKDVNLGILIFTLIFRILIILMSIVIIILKIKNSNMAIRYFDKLYRLITLGIYFYISYFLFKRHNLKSDYYVVEKFLISAIVTLLIYVGFTVLVIITEDYFIRHSLFEKINESERTEKLLHAFKLYFYDYEIEPSESSNRNLLRDICNMDVERNTLLELINTDPSTEIQNFNLKVNKPTIDNLNDAIILAKRTFEQSSRDGKNITYQDLATILRDKEIAEDACTFFDLNNDMNITRVEFRDTMVFFYKNRASLENSIASASHFITIIKRIVYSLLFMVLTAIDLIIFGINIQEIVALAISFGLAINFLGNKMIVEMWQNIIFLISHQFDVDDNVIVDDKPMKVYEIGLMTTSFLLDNGGKYKIMNSDLWKKKIVNMTKAPEKILLFTFELPNNTNTSQIHNLKKAIKQYLNHRRFDFYEDFKVSSVTNDKYEMSKINSMVKLKCKNFKTSSRKYLLRVEFTEFLNLYLKNNINSQ